MRAFARRILIVMTFVLAAAPIAAQDEMQIFAGLDDLYQATLPDGWGVSIAHLMPGGEYESMRGLENKVLFDFNAEGTLYILVLTPEQIAQYVDIPAAVSLFPGILDVIYEHIHGFPITPGTIEDEIRAGFLAYTHRYQIDDGGLREASLVVIDEDAPLYFYFDISGTEAIERRTELDVLLGTLRRFDNVPVVASTAAGGETCAVSTGEPRSATVRVGPGEHRTALLFLEPNRGYPVEGRFVEDDGDVWYRLVKDEVDPGSSAAELWTAAEGLQEVGNCATIGEASAPPLRPIVQARPTTPPGDTSTAGGDDDPDTTVAASGGAIPANGTWLITPAGTGHASCAGSNTIEFVLEDWDFDSTPFTMTMTGASDDGFNLGLDVFVRINDTAYLGDTNFSGVNVQAYFFPESANRMRGEIRYNLVFDGVGCSITIAIPASRL